MNYNSIQEIFDAGITNMEVLRNNSKNDDGTDSITGVSWFKFNNNVASTIYSSGNMWLGFGNTSEHFKVDRRDGACYYTYREEGTLYGYYKFLKIRWSGYTRYSETSSSYKITFDVILWDTGDISLHMIDIPTTYYDGTFSLTASTTYSYTKPTTSSPDVTFHSSNENNTAYTITYDILSLALPFDKKYLIRSSNSLFTVVDDQLSQLGTNVVSGSVFSQFGTDTPPPGNLLLGLDSFEVLYWQDSDDIIAEKTAIVTGATSWQSIISNQIDLTHPSITGIERATVTCEGNPLFCVSFDNKQTWRAWNGTQWSYVSEPNSAMTKALFEAITYDKWLELFTGAKSFYIKVFLTENELTQSVTQIYIDFAN